MRGLLKTSARKGRVERSQGNSSGRAEGWEPWQKQKLKPNLNSGNFRLRIERLILTGYTMRSENAPGQ